MNSDHQNWVVKPLVPEEIYTDRREFLDYFHKAALEAAHRRTMSTVLLGQRRMGKTEIFKRVVNRLFFEQDPKDPSAVVPVYYSFPDAIIDQKNFARDYLENFIRYYIGFKTRRPELVMEKSKGDKLLDKVKNLKSLFPFTRTFDLLFMWHDCIENGDCFIPQQDALEVPRRVSDIDDSTIVMFLDEFQNTRLPKYDFNIVGFMQEAVESPTCPHFVTGSAMSILGREIIGKGSLFGRFDSKEIYGMPPYHGAELAMRTAQYHRINLPKLMAPVIADRCGGNPFYISAVVRQSAKQGEPISNEEDLNKTMAVDVTSGFIWGELNDQVTRWINRINEHGITKWILYLSALEENEEKEFRNRLSLERIQATIQDREKKEVSLDKIREVLILLSRGDLVEYLELGNWFRRVKDPILLEFLKVWGQIEVEGNNRRQVQYELENQYSKIERQIHEYKGYLAEVHVSQVLLVAQRMTLPGKFFNTKEDIKMPWRFVFVRHRMRLGSGKGREIDVIGAAGGEVWVCQSKWTKGKTGVSVLRDLAAQGRLVKEDMDPARVRLWLFAHNGLTKPALDFARKHDILWSARKEFDELLAHLGLRTLPNL